MIVVAFIAAVCFGLQGCIFMAYEIGKSHAGDDPSGWGLSWMLIDWIAAIGFMMAAFPPGH